MKRKRINIVIREDKYVRAKEREVNLSNLMRNALDETLDGHPAITHTPRSPTYRNVLYILQDLDERGIKKGDFCMRSLLEHIISHKVGADKRTIKKYTRILIERYYLDKVGSGFKRL